MDACWKEKIISFTMKGRQESLQVMKGFQNAFPDQFGTMDGWIAVGSKGTTPLE
jgi:hypothetical protein